jgi:hypothetical protein
MMLGEQERREWERYQVVFWTIQDVARERIMARVPPFGGPAPLCRGVPAEPAYLLVSCIRGPFCKWGRTSHRAPYGKGTGPPRH